jgi:hypothetical protein
MKKRCSVVTLREGVQELIARYEAEAAAIREEVRVGRLGEWAGYRALGRACVLHQVASHLREHVRRSALLTDLAQALKDLVGCAEQSELDEENEAEAIYSRLRSRGGTCHRAAQQERRLRAVGRAQAYAEVQVEVNALIADWPIRLAAVQNYPGVPCALDPALEYLEVAPQASSRHGWCDPSLPRNLFPSFSPIPDALPAYQREWLRGLEQSLLAGRQSILVKMPRVEGTLGLLFASLDRLLRSPLVRRILIIPGSRSQSSGIRRHFTTYRSVEDGLSFADLYPVQDSLTVPLAEETRVCIAPIRQVQVCFSKGPEPGKHGRIATVPPPLSPESFDVVVVYGEPVVSPLWNKVLAYFRAVVICLSPVSTPELESLFSDQVIGEDGGAMRNSVRYPGARMVTSTGCEWGPTAGNGSLVTEGGALAPGRFAVSLPSGQKRVFPFLLVQGGSMGGGVAHSGE